MVGFTKYGVLFSGFLLLAFMVPFSASVTDPRDVLAMNSLLSSLTMPPGLGWLLGGDPCEEQWLGVSCVFTNITSLKLSGMDIGGTLTDDLSQFASIIEIDLSNNHIGGSIPSSLPPTLKSFSLSGNEFNGSIPESISLLTQLSRLSLNDNHLTGGIPDSFQQMTSLTTLNLSGNNLSGTLPPSMGNLSSLITLHVQNNRLGGVLDVLEDLPLQDLDIENNLFSGPIPIKLLSIPNFSKNGNPFNTTIIASPPLALPPFPAMPPSSADAPEMHGQWPTFTPTPDVEAETSKSKTFFTTKKAILVGVVAVFLIAIILVVCLVLACCKRGKVKEDAERHDVGYYKDTEKPNTNVSTRPSALPTVDHKKNMKPLQPPPPPPSSFPVDLVNPVMPAEANARTSPTKTLQSSGLKVFTIAELQQYTDSFSEESFIGEGTVGTVYKADLLDGKLLAVKKLNSTATRQQTDKEFLNLVSTLSKIRHPNIVQLVGYCNERGQRLLVYQYCEMGTLHDALHMDDEIHKKLSWNARIKLALGAARALQYLHEVCEPPIIHQNFRAGNILLDERLTVCVSDCGLAPLQSPGCTSELHGYDAPECELGYYTCKSDIYSFGVLMVELLTGRKAYDGSRGRGEQSLVRWAVPRLHDIDSLSWMVDPSLNGAYPAKSLSRFADIITKCLQGEPEFRPSMTEIVHDLLRMHDVGKN